MRIRGRACAPCPPRTQTPLHAHAHAHTSHTHARVQIHTDRQLDTHSRAYYRAIYYYITLRGQCTVYPSIAHFAFSLSLVTSELIITFYYLFFFFFIKPPIRFNTRRSTIARNGTVVECINANPASRSRVKLYSRNCIRFLPTFGFCFFFFFYVRVRTTHARCFRRHRRYREHTNRERT